jgi:glycosyltransferase involved in cell wall biosynthesis
MTLPAKPRLSVIIPTIDEAEVLPLLLGQLRQQHDIALEILIADGGSTDGSPEMGTRMGARVVTTDAGRGLQMNQAAAVSHGGFLLFLHADSTLTDERQLTTALDSLERRIEQRGDHRVAGHFRLRFQHRGSNRDAPYRYYEEKSALNRRECTNGDQGSQGL